MLMLLSWDCWKVWLARCWIATQHWRRSALANCSTTLSGPALQWTHCTCAVLLGPLRLPSANPLDLDCWSLRRLVMNPLMMCGLACSHSVFPGLSTAHFTYSETELRLYSQPLQRVTAEYTHLVDRQVDYPVFLSLPLTLSDLALATGEIPTEWFDRSLCNLWTDLRSALLYSALQLWKGQENFQKYSTEPLRVAAVWLEPAKVAGLKQFNRGYFSHSYVNATGAVNFELIDLETESSQTFQTAYTLAWRTLLTHSPRNWMALATAMLIVVFSLGICHWLSSKWKRLDLPALQLNWRSSLGTTTMALELRPCQSLRRHWSQGWHPDQRTWTVIHWHCDHCEEGRLRWHWETLNSDC